MLKFFHDCYLAFHAYFSLALLVQLELLINFDRKHKPSRLMCRHLHRCISTGTQMFSDLVVCDLGEVIRPVITFIGPFTQHNYLV